MSKDFVVKEEKNELILECPYCEEQNKVKLSKKIECKNCKKKLQGTNTIFSTNYLSIVAATACGVVIGAVGEDYDLTYTELIAVFGSIIFTYALTSLRPKLETEYKMMKTCIKLNSKAGRLDGQDNYTGEVRDNCFCVVKKLGKFITESLIKEKGESWVEEEIKKKYDECSNQTNG